MAKRGSAISVPDGWLEQCRNWRHEQGLTVEAAGARLARAIRRARPFADATVRRYLRGEVVTDELTQAFAKAMKVPIPVKIDNEKHQQWYNVGVRLESLNPKLFDAELARLNEFLAMLETRDGDDSE